MELRHLRYFIAVAEELHFGNAAKRLSISQPPLSQQIKQLEDNLGIRLFHRTNRSVQLTEAGKSLYNSSINIMNSLNSAIEEAKSTDRGIIGELKLGFSGTAVFNILPAIIKACSKYYPGISLHLSQLTTSEQLKALENRTIDLGLLVTPIYNSLINTEVVRTEEFVVCLPDTHRLASKDIINIADLKSEPFIMAPKESGIGYFESIKLIFDNSGFTPHISQTANEQLTMVTLVASGLGIVIVPKSMEAIKIKGIVYKNLNKSYVNTNSIAWIENNQRPVVNEFLKLLRQHIIPLYKKY